LEKLRSISITMIVAIYVLLLLVLISPLAALSLIVTEVSGLLRRYDQFDWRTALRSMMFAILGLGSPYFIFLQFRM